MAYEKIGFNSGDVLKASDLNHMEEGIKNATPVRGVDYYTEAEKEELLNQLSEKIVVDVKSYGATGDGVTDDTDAFIAALNAANVVRVPEGRYIISTALYIGQAKTLCGDGINSILICTSPENFLMLNAQTTVRDFTIQMQSNGFIGNAITVNEQSLATANLNSNRVDITIEGITITWHSYVYSQCANIELSLSGEYNGRKGFYGVTIRDVIADGRSTERDVGYFLRSYCAASSAWITYCSLTNCMAYATRWGIFMHDSDENFNDAYANTATTNGIDEFSVIGYRHQSDSNTKGFVYLRKNMRVQLTDSTPMDWHYAIGDYKEHPYCVDYDLYSNGFSNDYGIDIRPKPRIDRYMGIKPDGTVVKSDYKNLYEISKNIGTQYVELDLLPKQFHLKNGYYGACIYHTTSMSRIFADNMYYGVHFQLFDSDGILKTITAVLHTSTPYIVTDRPLATQTKFGYIKTDDNFRLFIYSTRSHDFMYSYLINLPISNADSSYSGTGIQSNYNKTINTFGWADADKFLSSVPTGIVQITDVQVYVKDGKTPVKGTDYFTAADKTEMVNAVISALPVYNGEVV